MVVSFCHTRHFKTPKVSVVDYQIADCENVWKKSNSFVMFEEISTVKSIDFHMAQRALLLRTNISDIIMLDACNTE